MGALLVDLGNSRLKWRLIDRGRREEGALAIGEAASFLAWLKPQAEGLSLWLASVARSVEGMALAEALLALPFDRSERVRVRPELGGIVLGYREPAELGVDRWLALLAARPLAPCVVALAGTCLTLDGLDGGGRHWPGGIVPGLQAMEAQLTGPSLALRGSAAARSSPPPGGFAKGTGEAVAIGPREALCGAIERFRRRLARALAAEPTLLLAGGHAELLAAALEQPALIRPPLVLDGLERLARESAGT